MNVLNGLKETADLSEKCRKEIYDLSEKLAISNLYQINARNEIFSGMSDRPIKIGQLLRTIHLYIETLSISSECRQLYNENSESILQTVKELSAGANGISWLFSSSKRKAKAEVAYERLNAEISSLFFQNANELLNQVSNIQNIPDSKVWEFFSNNSEIYGKVFRQYASQNAESGANIPEFSEVLDKLEILRGRLLNVYSVQNQKKADVQRAGERMLAQDVINVLKTIPVEEINRDKSGIRVKALRESGFSNIADLFAASVYQIASVRGISEDTAHTVKRLSNQIIARVQKETKLKLSVDNKTKEATNLVSTIYAYRKAMEIIEEAKAFEAKNNTTIDYDASCLHSVKNGAPWLFFTANQKAEIVKSWHHLQEQIEGPYASEIHRIETAIKKPKQFSKDETWEDFSENNIAYFNILEEILPGSLGNDDKLYGLPEELAREIQEECFFPDGLNCELRRYQEWGVKYILHQEKVLLGDEMGLGKTIQAIATMVSLRNTGATHFVVVCPASVLPNWCKEIAEKSKLRVTTIHGAGRKWALQSWVKTGGVAVTTYETTAFFRFDDNYKFELLVVDEAHYIKNEGTRRSENVRSLCSHAKRLLFMTGTALENRVEEMISLINVLQPEIALQIKSIAFMSAAPQFRERIAPVYYRRKREDVLTELPDLIESKEWCTLFAEEEQIYEQTILGKNYMEIRRLSWNAGDLKKSCKAIRMLELIEEAESEGRKVLVFSFFLETLRSICAFLGDRCLNPINGSISPQRRQEIIDEFDKAPAGTVLCAQIQSGGTGLNIQAASVVIICEPQFKPSVENQAISRAYRMGQARNVLVYRLLCADTVDEKITELLVQKQAIFNAFADKSVAAAVEKENEGVDEKTFGKIIEDEIERIKAKNGERTIRAEANNEKALIETTESTANNQDTVASFVRRISTERKQFTPISFEDSPKTLSVSKNTDYDMEMKMTYAELVHHLLQKYGSAKEDYFLNEGCYTKNKRIMRTKEGLICHHIDEDKAIMLCNDKYAKNNPFAYQKADRLVYCNILEHFLLHIKIAEEPRDVYANEKELPGIGGAANIICRQINDYYDGYEFSREWQVIEMSILEGHFEDYIRMLQYLWDIVKKNPVYSKEISLKQLSCGWKGNIIEKIYGRLK